METKKRKRDVSRERTIALALVEVIENYQTFEAGSGDEMDNAITSAKSILDSHGYKGLESISSRVAKLETAINAAVVDRNGKEIARLGAELNRAQRGLPPIAKAKEPAVKKRKKKGAPGNGLDEGKQGEQVQP